MDQLSSVTSDPLQMQQHEISNMPQCPLGEPRTWKDYRTFETIQASFLCPCMEMKVDICNPAVPLHPKAAKFRARDSFSGLQGFCSH